MDFFGSISKSIASIGADATPESARADPDFTPPPPTELSGGPVKTFFTDKELLFKDVYERCRVARTTADNIVAMYEERLAIEDEYASRLAALYGKWRERGAQSSQSTRGASAAGNLFKALGPSDAGVVESGIIGDAWVMMVEQTKARATSQRQFVAETRQWLKPVADWRARSEQVLATVATEKEVGIEVLTEETAKFDVAKKIYAKAERDAVAAASRFKKKPDENTARQVTDALLIAATKEKILDAEEEKLRTVETSFSQKFQKRVLGPLYASQRDRLNVLTRFINAFTERSIEAHEASAVGDQMVVSCWKQAEKESELLQAFRPLQELRARDLEAARGGARNVAGAGAAAGGAGAGDVAPSSPSLMRQSAANNAAQNQAAARGAMMLPRFDTGAVGSAAGSGLGNSRLRGGIGGAGGAGGAAAGGGTGGGTGGIATLATRKKKGGSYVARPKDDKVGATAMKNAPAESRAAARGVFANPVIEDFLSQLRKQWPDQMMRLEPAMGEAQQVLAGGNAGGAGGGGAGGGAGSGLTQSMSGGGEALSSASGRSVPGLGVRMQSEGPTQLSHGTPQFSLTSRKKKPAILMSPRSSGSPQHSPRGSRTETVGPSALSPRGSAQNSAQNSPRKSSADGASSDAAAAAAEAKRTADAAAEKMKAQADADADATAAAADAAAAATTTTDAADAGAADAGAAVDNDQPVEQTWVAKDATDAVVAVATAAVTAAVADPAADAAAAAAVATDASPKKSAAADDASKSPRLLSLPEKPDAPGAEPAVLVKPENPAPLTGQAPPPHQLGITLKGGKKKKKGSKAKKEPTSPRASGDDAADATTTADAAAAAPDAATAATPTNDAAVAAAAPAPDAAAAPPADAATDAAAAAATDAAAAPAPAPAATPAPVAAATEATTRKCVDCNEEKPRDEFSKNQWGKGDGESACKDCA